MFRKITKKTSNDEIQTEIKELEKVDYLPLYNKDVPYHNYGYIHTFRVISDGLKLSWLKQLMGGLLAGIWIGAAYTGVSYATYTIDNASVTALLTGIIFAGVILMISFLGGGFVTAHMWYNRTMFKRVERWQTFLKACAWVYLGNIIGIGIFVMLLFVSGAFENSALLAHVYDAFGIHKLFLIGSDLLDKGGYKAADADKWIANPLSSITNSAYGESIVWALASAILCNFLICLATQGAKSAKGNTVASMIMYLMVLFFFAIGGYQHCVANWYGAWVLIFMCVDAWGGHLQYFNDNAAWLYLIFNIIPAIIGNFIGALLMGFFMGWFNKDFDDLLLKEARLRFLRDELDQRTNAVMKQDKALTTNKDKKIKIVNKK